MIDAKVVLAYSGGLDTSVILKWLQDTYRCEVVTFTADIGQGEELEPARARRRQRASSKSSSTTCARSSSAISSIPMFRANAIYEGEYLLGTSIARPLIAKRQIEIARETGADAVAHGATGKGNDQVRFELGYYALEPDIQVIAPWREWDLTSREKLLAYAEKHGIPIEMKHTGRRQPYSMDANLLHISYEGRALGRSGAGARGGHVALDGVAGEGAGRGRVSRARIRARRHRRGQRQGHDAGAGARPSSTGSAASTASAGSIWSRTATSA